MKTKLFTFLGLVIAGIGILSVAQSSPAYAAGETYRWANSTTIEASGGLYSQIRSNAGVGKTLIFTRESDGIYIQRGVEGGEGDFSKCSLNFRLVVGSDNVSGVLTVNDPSGDCDAKSGFDKNVRVENPNSGPPMPGQEVDYRTIDCAVAYAGEDNFDRCAAVKACVVNKNLAVLDCLRAWYTCLISRTVNGSVSADKRAECARLVTEGNLAEAGKGIPVGGGTSPDDKTTCSIPGLGWVICPAIYFLASLTDGTYYVIDALLRVQPILATPGSDTEGLYNAWQVMRNFANVAFVIAFLVIIFSQVTSAGVSNYGIKKLLPRLIVAAILVNISYWICAIAVDLSNIAGSSLKSLFDAIAAQVDLKPVGGPGSTSGLTGISEFVLGGAIVGFGMYIMLSALLPVLVGCLITVIIVFVVLVMRQALIVLLIAISPLAFVAYLLPNTEKLFNQWRDLFWTLLLMYPAIALIFGASAFASKIVTGGS